jgi:lysozyme
MTRPLPSGPWRQQAMNMLKLDEGVVDTPYKDSLGFWTIGVGRFIGKDIYKLRLSERIINEMLIEDMEEAWQAVIRIFGWDLFKDWSAARQLATINLAFNLGQKRLEMFTNTIAAIKKGNWNEAADHLQKSLWAKQVKSRSVRVIHMIRTGSLHESYSADH